MPTANPKGAVADLKVPKGHLVETFRMPTPRVPPQPFGILRKKKVPCSGQAWPSAGWYQLICMSTHMSLRMSVRMPVHVSVHMSAHMPPHKSAHMPAGMPVHGSLHMSLHMSVSPC